jgi:hypothetical protein
MSARAIATQVWGFSVPTARVRRNKTLTNISGNGLQNDQLSPTIFQLGKGIPDGTGWPPTTMLDQAVFSEAGRPMLNSVRWIKPSGLICIEISSGGRLV